MKPGDAFGMALEARLQDRPSGHLIERDDGNVDWMTADYYFGNYADWRSHEKSAVAYARGRVLDVGCGAGRHALHLQRKGRRVTGIDVSPGAVRVARARGLRNVRRMSITDIGRFPAGSFDTIVMFGNNFGLFGSRARASRLLKVMRRITSPGARRLVSCNDPQNTTNPLHLRYQARNRARGRMAGQIRLRIRYANVADTWCDYLFVTRPEMRKLLQETGWHVRKFFKSTGGRFPAYAAVIEKD